LRTALLPVVYGVHPTVFQIKLAACCSAGRAGLPTKFNLHEWECNYSFIAPLSMKLMAALLNRLGVINEQGAPLPL
jgi:hypothetical protein